MRRLFLLVGRIAVLSEDVLYQPAEVGADIFAHCPVHHDVAAYGGDQLASDLAQGLVAEHSHGAAIIGMLGVAGTGLALLGVSERQGIASLPPDPTPTLLALDITGTYNVSMTTFRISVTVLAVIHAVFAGFTALVGAFANGGDVWQRLVVVLLHPLGAAGLLLLVLRPRLATTTILAIVALLTANVIADLGVAQLIAAGSVRGDWELALAFSVVPAIGIVYGLALLRTARETAG